MQNQTMDRGTDAMKAHLSGCDKMDIRQTRRGWCQEMLGCEAKTEFRYFIGDQQIAHSLDDASCCCRFFCPLISPFVTVVKEVNTEAELLTVKRPCACAPGACKCCCYQTASFSSGGVPLGSIKENCYYCVPQYKIRDDQGKDVYTVHPPTCCGGCCVNCCAEGNPCTRKGCCKASFRMYAPGQSNTNGDAPYVGQILKKPKSAMVEIFTDADAFEVAFPNDASVEQKALLVGTAIFLNANHFEENANSG
jgi:hypothetical protein